MASNGHSLVRCLIRLAVLLIRRVYYMAFRLPTFNLTIDLYRLNGVGGTYGIPDVTTVGNISPGKRVLSAQAKSAGIAAPYHVMELLLPKLTDIRGFWNGVVQDLVEAPSGSKRFYTVMFVDDVAKGFANEYRIALLTYQVNGNANLVGGPFAAPVPMP